MERVPIAHRPALHGPKKWLEAEDRPQQRGLAGPVHPDEACDLPAASENETWRRTSRPDNETDRSSTDRAAPSRAWSAFRSSGAPVLVPGFTAVPSKSPWSRCQQGVNLGQHPGLILVAGDGHRLINTDHGDMGLAGVGQEASGQAVGDLLVVQEDLDLVAGDQAAFGG